MEKSKSIISLIIIVATALIFLGAIAFSFLFPTNYVEDDSKNYKIQSLNTIINLNKDNTLDITENYVVNFPRDAEELSHGLYRAIPLVNSVKYTDNSGKVVSKNYSVKISNVEATRVYDMFYEDDFFVIQLGSAYSYANEFENYTISYTLQLPNDRIFEYDQFYFNILGNFWNTTIDNFSAEIEFFESVENQKDTLKIFKGTFGSSNELDDENFGWSNNFKTLSVTASNLAVGEGLTVKMLFENNYFDSEYSYLPIYIAVVGIIVVAIISLLLFIKHNNKTKLIPVVQFKPKANLTSADIGYIMDKKVDNKDIASLIIYWAEKGYVKIIEEDKITYIQKLKNASSSMKMYEKTMFNAIFADDSKDKISIKFIGEKLVNSFESIRKNIKEENQKSFDKTAVFARGAICALTGIVFGAVFALLNILTVHSLLTIFSIILGILLIVEMASIAMHLDKNYFEHNNKKVLATILNIIIIALLFGFAYVSYEAFVDVVYLSFITPIFVIFEMLLVSKFNVRTDEGMKDLGDIAGLKNFIETAEKSRLEMLCNDNPEFFYQILPYAYVLGVYEKWCKKFEGIALEKPSWYVSDNDTLNAFIWISIINNSCGSFSRGIDLARISNASHSGGSGGGFSGGGFGGGGGGRW